MDPSGSHYPGCFAEQVGQRMDSCPSWLEAVDAVCYWPRRGCNGAQPAAKAAQHLEWVGISPRNQASQITLDSIWGGGNLYYRVDVLVPSSHQVQLPLP